MRIVRLILILLIGGLLTYFTHKFKYIDFLFDGIIYLGLILVGIILFVWTIITDFKLCKLHKQIKNFALTFLILLFVAVNLTLGSIIQKNFNKPTLLKASYYGDLNGTDIDFKADGTYILNNYSVMIDTYFYGTYTIIGNKITMDKDTIDVLPNLKYLEIRNKQIQEGQADLYLYQVDSLGNFIKDSFYEEYKVIIDNRTNASR